MTVEKRQVKLAANTEAMERALSRLVRTVNRIDQLRRERKRLLKPRPFTEQPEVAAGLDDKLPPTLSESCDAIVSGMIQGKSFEEADDGLDIPPALDRNRKLQAMADPKTKEKKAERRSVEKQVRDAELTGKRRKMPLTGKAAMEHILGEAIYGKRDSR